MLLLLTACNWDVLEQSNATKILPAVTPSTTPSPVPATLTPTKIPFPSLTPVPNFELAVTATNPPTPTFTATQTIPLPSTKQMKTATPSPISFHATDSLVFMTGSGGSLYTVKEDGTDLQWLTDGVIDPSLSPNRQQVAFTRWDGAEFGALFTINLSNKQERVIVGNIRQPKSPTWSPDGRKIMVSFQYGGLRDPRPECRTFDSDDGFRLPDNIEILDVSFEKNGLKVCFVRKEDLRWALRLIDVETGQFEDMSASSYSYNPAWDPQQPWRVIYSSDKGLMQLDVTGAFVSLSRTGNLWPISKDVRDSGPIFSPDGKTLALSYKQHDHWEVYTFDLVSGQRQRLTKPPFLAVPQYSSASPAWSPDGQRIAFVTNRTRSDTDSTSKKEGIWEIWVMNADGSDPRPLLSPEDQANLKMSYWGMNERMVSW